MMLRKHMGAGHASQKKFSDNNNNISEENNNNKNNNSNISKHKGRKKKSKCSSKSKRNVEPIRFALKVTPPTIILEFRDKNKGEKLYLRQFTIKKLKGDSNVDKVTKNLQKKCKNFLAAHLVETKQLRRLVQKLVDHQLKIESAKGNDNVKQNDMENNAVEEDDDDDERVEKIDMNNNIALLNINSSNTTTTDSQAVNIIDKSKEVITEKNNVENTQEVQKENQPETITAMITGSTTSATSPKMVSPKTTLIAPKKQKSPTLIRNNAIGVKKSNNEMMSDLGFEMDDYDDDDNDFFDDDFEDDDNKNDLKETRQVPEKKKIEDTRAISPKKTNNNNKDDDIEEYDDEEFDDDFEDDFEDDDDLPLEDNADMKKLSIDTTDSKKVSRDLPELKQSTSPLAAKTEGDKPAIKIAIDGTVDLNKVSHEELQAAKDAMKVDFVKNSLKPGDEGYIWDKRVEFNVEDNSEDDSWDDDSEEDDDDYDF